jgi:hypothetical protein
MPSPRRTIPSRANRELRICETNPIPLVPPPVFAGGILGPGHATPHHAMRNEPNPGQWGHPPDAVGGFRPPMNADQRGLKTKTSSALIGVHPRLKTFSPVSPNLPATMAQREFTKRTQSHLYRRRSLPAVFLVSDTPHTPRHAKRTQSWSVEPSSRCCGRIQAAYERRSTRIENKNLIGVNRCSSATQNVFPGFSKPARDNGATRVYQTNPIPFPDSGAGRGAHAVCGCACLRRGRTCPAPTA